MRVYEASFKRKNRSNHWPFNMKSVKSVLLKLILTSSQKLTEWKKFAPLSTLERIFLICAKTILHTQIISIPFISKYLDPYTGGPRIVQGHPGQSVPTFNQYLNKFWWVWIPLWLSACCQHDSNLLMTLGFG